MNVITPDVDTVTTDENSVCVGVLIHRFFEILSQVLLMRSVLDDWNAKGVMIAQVACLVHATAKALNLLNIVDLENSVFSGALGF